MQGKRSDFFDISMARGVRRFTASNHKKEIFSDVDFKFSRAKSFEGNARRVVRHFQDTFGKDCVHVYRLTSKVVSILNIFHMPEGFSIPLAHEMSRKKVFSGKHDQEDIKDRLSNYIPIVMTAHFVERFIQSSAATEKTIANVIYELWRATQSEMYPAVTGADEIYPIWKRVGDFAFATPEFLILGRVPADEELICQTVIRVDRLEAAKARLWELARQQVSSLVIK